MRISETLRKNKKNFVIYAILWLIGVIVFVMPFCIGAVDGKIGGQPDLSRFMEISLTYIKTPFSSFNKVFNEEYIQTFKEMLLWFTVACVGLAIIGTIRNASRSEYENIEHGSSDWSKNGEQYKILNKSRGIILAEDNYLPLDKRGNTNVLVVGRFRVW